MRHRSIVFACPDLREFWRVGMTSRRRPDDVAGILATDVTLTENRFHESRGDRREQQDERWNQPRHPIEPYVTVVLELWPLAFPIDGASILMAVRPHRPSGLGIEACAF